MLMTTKGAFTSDGSLSLTSVIIHDCNFIKMLSRMASYRLLFSSWLGQLSSRPCRTKMISHPPLFKKQANHTNAC